MNFYNKYILPRLINRVMQTEAELTERKIYLSKATGETLEIGFGSGVNLPYYGVHVSKLYAVDPSKELWQLAEERVKKANFPVKFINGSAEKLPFADQSFDTVVSTWALCTIPNPAAALKEVRRVLKPEGKYIFIEHGLSPDEGVKKWQNKINSIWRKLAGGCNLNRKIPELFPPAGLLITEINADYNSWPKILTYLYRGVAKRAE